MLTSSENLKEIAMSVNITQIGVTTAGPLLYMQDRLQRRLKEGRVTPFEEKEPRLRLSPALLLEDCRSVITLAVPYTPPDRPGPGPLSDQPRGKVARCARAVDYHLLVESKAALVAEKIRREFGGGLHYRILSDRSPLIERELARNSDLGLVGENCTLINDRYGSYTGLGTILINREIPPDQPDKRTCFQCGACREACPTGALAEPYIIDPSLCLSYLTQAAGVFPARMRPLLGGQVYGCDICQEACPHNKSVECSPYPEAAFPLFPAEPFLIPLLQLTRKEFDHTIALTSAGWRGKTTLQRNAVIALGNRGNRLAVKPLARLLENDPRPLIRQHAAWSLGRLGGGKAGFALEKALQNDPEPTVKEEAAAALAAMKS